MNKYCIVSVILPKTQNHTYTLHTFDVHRRVLRGHPGDSVALLNIGYHPKHNLLLRDQGIEDTTLVAEHQGGASMLGKEKMEAEKRKEGRK